MEAESDPNQSPDRTIIDQPNKLTHIEMVEQYIIHRNHK
jgi:hypothetical protein